MRLDWIATSFQLPAACLLAANVASSRWAFPMFIVGGVFWMAHAIRTRQVPLFIMQAVFSSVDVVAIARWF